MLLVVKTVKSDWCVSIRLSCNTVVAVFFLSALKEYTSVELISEIFSMCAIFFSAFFGPSPHGFVSFNHCCSYIRDDACFKSFLF